MKPKPLTKKQKETLDFLKDFNRRNGYMPTVDEVSRKFDLRSSSSGFARLKELEKKSWIKRSSKPRMIVINEYPS